MRPGTRGACQAQRPDDDADKEGDGHQRVKHGTAGEVMGPLAIPSDAEHSEYVQHIGEEHG